MEGLKEEEGNHHQLEDEDVAEVGTQVEDEAEAIGQENLTILMTSEYRLTLIIMMTTVVEMGASHLLEETSQNIPTTPSEPSNGREIMEVSVVNSHTALTGVNLRTASTRWASMKSI